jgi:hypothetical protein
MTDTVKDVRKLFIDKASFIAGTKRQQMGFDTTLKLAMLHDDTSDVISWEVSDDSLQCLLAGTQTITGAKTFSANTTFNEDIVLGSSCDITGSPDFTITDNIGVAFAIREAFSYYLAISTSNGSEYIRFGNSSNNPLISFLSTSITSFAGNVQLQASVAGILDHTIDNTNNAGSAQSSLTVKSITSGGANSQELKLISGTGVTTSGPTLAFNTARITGSVNTTGAYITTNSSDPSVTIDGGAIFAVKASWDGTEVGKIIINMGSDTGNKDDASMHLQVAVGGVLTNVINLADNGRVGIGELNPTSKLYVHQPLSSGAIPVLHLQQSDADDSLINFGGTIGANNTASISSFTTSGALTHHIKCEINGQIFWIPGSTNNPTA